jgi:hypothetical protein
MHRFRYSFRKSEGVSALTWFRPNCSSFQRCRSLCIAEASKSCRWSTPPLVWAGHSSWLALVVRTGIHTSNVTENKNWSTTGSETRHTQRHAGSVMTAGPLMPYQCWASARTVVCSKAKEGYQTITKCQAAHYWSGSLGSASGCGPLVAAALPPPPPARRRPSCRNLLSSSGGMSAPSPRCSMTSSLYSRSLGVCVCVWGWGGVGGG